MENDINPDNIVALSKYPDIEVTVYEAAKEFSEVGAGIGVWPRVWKILAHLGLDSDMAKMTASKPSYDEGPLKFSFIFLYFYDLSQSALSSSGKATNQRASTSINYKHKV